MVYKNLRIQFEKRDELKYISHLDLCRTLRTALKRAGIAVRYSEGFNPHPRMTFTLPPPLGTESLCEYMDIQVPQALTGEQVCEGLNRQSTPALRFLRAYEPASKLTDIAFAAYDMEFSGAYDQGQIESVLKNPPTIMKKTKKGIERAVPLAPFIHGYTLESAPHALRLTVRLSASPQAYLNPEHLAGLFEAEAIQITRRAVFFSDGTPFS